MISSWVQGRGLESWRQDDAAVQAGRDEILLSSNENPVGPGETVLAAVRRGLGPAGSEAGRYPFVYENPLSEAIAEKFRIKPENVLLGCGSTQILVTATSLYVSREKALVGALPTFEECSKQAALIGAAEKAIPLDNEYRTDLEHTLHAAKGAGLLYYCNPSNPVGTLVTSGESKEFIQSLLRRSPGTRVLVDEAYFDYVADPGHESMIPLALDDPRVIVARTFSKAYGMAGLRIGYAIAHADTLKEMAAWHMGDSISGAGYVAAIAAIGQPQAFLDDERERNRQVREYTVAFFAELGLKPARSETNFVFLDIGMPVEEFQAACKSRGVRVGRPFPPYWTHARISLGTMEEMKQATRVFRDVLDAARKSAA